MRKRFFVLVAMVLASVQAWSQEAPSDTFMNKFAEAVKTDNYAAMKDLVIRNKEYLKNGFFAWEYQLASAISNKNDEDKTARSNVLEKLANLASQEFKDRFFQDRIAWAKTLTPEQAAKRMQIGDLLVEGFKVYSHGEKSGEAKDFSDARGVFEKMYPITLDIKDVYWMIDVNVWLGQTSEKLNEKFEMAYYFKRAMEVAREEKATAQLATYNIGEKLKKLNREGLQDDVIDVKISVDESKKKYAAAMEKKAADALNPTAAGADSKPAGAAGGSSGGAKAALPTALPPLANKHTMRIEWADAEKSKYEEAAGRPTMTANVRANAPWYKWYNTDLQAQTATKLQVIPGEHTFKNDKGKLVFDPDGPGKAPEEKIKVALGKADMNVFKGRTFPDGSKVDVHALVLERPKSWNVNGVTMNFKAPGPADAHYFHWQGATAATTKFNGYDITIYDDNCNGDFATYGDDSVVISQKGKVVRSEPLSRYLYLGDLLYEMKVDPNGQNVKFKPYDGPLALVQFEWVGKSDPAFMILEGLNENAQAFFNMVVCKDKPMWIPPGEYKFRNGYFAFGDGEKRETIDVLNTKCSSFRVAEGALNKLQMGAAKAPGFTCIWKAEIAKDKGKVLIQLKGKDIKIFGCAGEEYVQMATGQFRPVVKMKSGKDGPAFYDKEMKPTATEDLQNGRAWTEIAFAPKDIETEKAVAGDVYIQLEGDYPKLGKITSTPSKVE